MPQWGTHGTQTKDLWHRFFTEIQQPTAEFAGGKSCPTMQFNPFEYGPVATALFYKTYDQACLDGGQNIHAVGLNGEDLGSGPRFVTDEIRRGIWQEALRRMLFPSEFFRFGQDYLLRLRDTKPENAASVGAKLVWAVDAAWWLNMMFGALNIYPTWIPNALGLALDGSWMEPDGISMLQDVFARVPVFQRVTNTSWPYAVPLVTNPGDFNSTGYIKNITNPVSSSSLQKVQRLVGAAPWLRGIGTYAGIDQARATREDPSGDANLLRAAMQHTFFQLSGDLDFFALAAELERDATKRQQFLTFFDTALPAWISVMSALSYWGLVRAGVDSWRHYAVGSLTVDGRYPYTAPEISELQRIWKDNEREQRGFLALSAQLQTMLSIVQAVATGSLGRSQLAAVQMWYQFATFRYKEPKSWERAWEIHPVLMRLIRANSACDCLRVYPDQGGQPPCISEIRDCDARPDPRVYSGGKMGVHADQGIGSIDVLGGFAIAPDTDATTQVVRTLEEASAPPKSASTDVVPVVVGQSQYSKDTSSKSTNWKPAAVVGVLSLLAGGIILATRKGR